MEPNLTRPEISIRLGSDSINNEKLLHPINGFNSTDNIVFTKKVNENNHDYTIAIKFKPTDSNEEKEKFLTNFGANAAKTVQVAVNLGLGAMKISEEINQDNIGMTFTFDNDKIVGSKTITNKDGPVETILLEIQPPSAKDDQLNINKSLRSMRQIFKEATGTANIMASQNLAIAPRNNNPVPVIIIPQNIPG